LKVKKLKTLKIKNKWPTILEVEAEDILEEATRATISIRTISPSLVHICEGRVELLWRKFQMQPGPEGKRFENCGKNRSNFVSVARMLV
jgi:hypothetical protein